MRSALLRTRWLVAAGCLLVIGGAVALAANAQYESRLLKTAPNAIPARAGLMAAASRNGRVVFAGHCASCHGAEGQGNPAIGAARLNDRDWLYGSGTVEEIERTITFGIRSHTSKAWNLAAMPGFARANPSNTQKLSPLSPGQIDDLVAYLRTFQASGVEEAPAQRGAALFRSLAAGCSDCHGPDAKGDSAIGAPNLTDQTWLYGDGQATSIFRSIAEGRQGVCPSWFGHLSPRQIREVSLYVFGVSHKPAAVRG